MSPAPDRTLTDLQQIIADLERRLAERTAALTEAQSERDEALARETATAEVLGVMSSSPGRLEPVFNAILANAVRICGGASGVLALIDRDGFHGASTHGVGTN